MAPAQAVHPTDRAVTEEEVAAQQAAEAEWSVVEVAATDSVPQAMAIDSVEPAQGVDSDWRSRFAAREKRSVRAGSSRPMHALTPLAAVRLSHHPRSSDRRNWAEPAAVVVTSGTAQLRVSDALD